MSDNTITQITINPKAERPLIANWHKISTVGDFTPEDGEKFLGGVGGGFLATLLDVINPLQHIPVVSTIYRSMTGDAISPAARVIGGALLGGPVGAALGVANAAMDVTSGKDFGQQVASLFGAGGTPAQATESATQLAENEAAVPAAKEMQLAMNEAPGQPVIQFGTPQSAEERAAAVASNNMPLAGAATKRFIPLNREGIAQPIAISVPQHVQPAALKTSTTVPQEEPLFYAPAEGEIKDWYHEGAVMPAKKSEADKAYKKMQLLPLAGLARS